MRGESRSRSGARQHLLAKQSRIYSTSTASLHSRVKYKNTRQTPRLLGSSDLMLCSWWCRSGTDVILYAYCFAFVFVIFVMAVEKPKTSLLGIMVYTSRHFSHPVQSAVMLFPSSSAASSPLPLLPAPKSKIFHPLFSFSSTTTLCLPFLPLTNSLFGTNPPSSGNTWT